MTSRFYHPCEFAGLLPLLAILLTACTQLQVEPPTAMSPTEPSAAPITAPSSTVCSTDPVPSLTMMPSPTASDVDPTRTEMSVCHVFIVEYEEQIGGMPALMGVVYVARDGTVQQTGERNDDIVLTRREGSVDVSDIFQSLNNFEMPSLPEEGPGASSGGVVLPEYVGPTLLVEVAFCNAPASQWVGNPDVAPHVLQQLVESTKALAQTLPSQPIAPGRRYIRGQLLTTEKAGQLREAGLVIDISHEQLESSPLLKQAITHERRLIRVDSDESPYAAIPLSFEHGRSAHVAYGDQVFQIRHLLTVEP